MKHLPAFKAAIFAIVGIFLGKEFPQYQFLFLAAALGFLILSSAWFFLRRERVSSVIASGIYAALSFAFAFYMSTNLTSVDSGGISKYRCFAGTVEERPRDSLATSIILNDCYGYDAIWRKIHGEIVITPKFKGDFKTGDRIIFVGKTGAISEGRNPGQFNFKSYYALSGIMGRVYVENREDVLYVYHDSGFGFRRRVVEPVRDFFRDKIKKFMGGEEAELARAMVIGERTGINRDVNEQFINTGTVHILSVSGLHIGFFTAILMTMASLLKIPRRSRFFVIAPILILYAFVVGMTPSITRAVIMAIVVLFGLFLQRRTQILNSLGFAALAIVTFSPSQLFSPGFQLSFAAVLSIAFFHEKILAMVRKSHPALEEKPFLNSVVSLSILTIAATLGTVPLTVYYFNRVSLISILANLLIVPLAGIFTTMSFTFIFFSLFSSSLASIYGAATQLLGFFILQINSMLGSLSISSARVADSGWIFASLYLLWLLAVAAFGKNNLWKKFALAVLLGANLLLYASFFGGKPEAKLFVLDVGQGDAIYLELPDGKNMLVDAGMKFGTYDAGERVIIPFLERRGVEKLDYFVMTHLHSDHIGGAALIIRKLKVANFVYPDQFSRSESWIKTLASVHALKIPTKSAQAGMILDSGSMYRVYVLHPNRTYVGVGGRSYDKKLNDGSIVLKVSIGKESFLLVGDVERRVEHELVGVYGNFLSSNIYKAGHHGSITSSSSEFVREIHPAYAVISVGARNSFGHPSSNVLNEMSQEGIEIWRTDLRGAAYFRVNMDTTELVQWR